MVGIVETYANLNYSSGGEYEPTADNFPSCAHFFRCSETGAATSITDAITGQTVAVTSFSNPTTGAIDCTVAAATLSGAGITSPGTKAVVALAVGNLALLGIVIGSAATAHLTISGATIGSQVQGDDGLKSATAVTGGAVYGTGFKYELDTPEVISFEMNDAAGYVEKAAVTLGSTTTVTGLENNFSLSAGNTSLFGLALFYFDTLPTDIEQAVAWMTEQWRTQNNKVIYPGWKGLT